MEEFFKALFSALSAELPFMAVLLLGAVMWLFGSTGVFIGGGKIDERVRTVFRGIGSILTYFGAITTLVTVSLFFWNFLQPYQSYFTSLWTILRVVFSPIVLVVIFSVAVIAILGVIARN